MPGLDRNGPTGAGAMTGGQRGLCNPASARFQRGYGRGLGLGRSFRGGRTGIRGRGFGQGRSLRRPAEDETVYIQASQDELTRLQSQANSMQNALDKINRRITTLAENDDKPDNLGKPDDLKEE